MRRIYLSCRATQGRHDEDSDAMFEIAHEGNRAPVLRPLWTALGGRVGGQPYRGLGTHQFDVNTEVIAAPTTPGKRDLVAVGRKSGQKLPARKCSERNHAHRRLRHFGGPVMREPAELPARRGYGRYDHNRSDSQERQKPAPTWKRGRDCSNAR